MRLVLPSPAQSRRNDPFFMIFEYFQRHGHDQFHTAEPNPLWDQFAILLRGYIRKEVNRLKGQADPQMELLKRRFKEILAEHPYNRHDHPANRVTWVIRSNGEPVSETHREYRQAITEIVETAYLKSKSRTEWCNLVFDLVEEQQPERPCVNHHELISAAVGANLRYNELSGFSVTALPGAAYGLITAAAERAREEALKHLREVHFRRFTAKNRLTDDCCRRFEQAFDLYLNDLLHSGETDTLPVYFRQVMPEETHDRYLQDYKYTFETVINEGRNHFARSLEGLST